MKTEGKGILFPLYFSLVALTLMMILISNVSASTINRTYTEVGGDIKCDTNAEKSIKHEINAGNAIFVAYKGEKMKFFDDENEMRGIRIDGPFTAAGSPKSSNFKTSFISTEWGTEGKYEGYYRFSDDANGNGIYFEEEGEDNQGWLSLDTHTFRLGLNPSGKAYEDGSLIFSIESNNKEAGFVKFSIETKGHSIRDVNGNDIYEIPIKYEEEARFYSIYNDFSGVNILPHGEVMLNMSGLDVEEGRYTIILEDFATEVKKKINFEIEAREIEIETADTVIKGETVEIIVKSAFSKKEARLCIDDALKEKVILNDEGEKMFRRDTLDIPIGRHKIEIEVDVDGDGKFEGSEDEEASRYIEVVEGEVSIDLSNDTIMIGDSLEIFGKSNYGDYAVILIDDKYVEKAKITRGKFECEYETSGETEGAKKIEVFIDAPIDFAIGESVKEGWKLKNCADADAEFTLIESRVMSLNLPPIVAKGDDVLINGTARGTEGIYLLVMNSKGEMIFPYEGVVIASEIKDNRYEEKLINPDSGTYTVIALHKGRDGVTDAIYDGKWVIGDESKTLDQRIAIVEDRIKRAGSDDIFLKKEFKVVNPEVRLILEDTSFILGEKMPIIATTNIKDGVISWVSVEKGKNKEIKTVKVENGTIIAEFDTNKLSVGEWKVRVNIPDRCSDEGMINIKPVKPMATATITTVTPSPNAIIPSPTPVMSKSKSRNTTETPVPGFEAIFAILALIILHLVRKH